MPLGTMLTMLGLTALLVAAALSFAVMLGSLIRRSTLSILLAFLLLFIVLPIVSFALSAANTPSWWIITSAANVVVNPSTGLGAVSYTPAGTIALPSLSAGVIALAVYARACGLAGVVLFTRRDYAP